MSPSLTKMPFGGRVGVGARGEYVLNLSYEKRGGSKTIIFLKKLLSFRKI